MRAKPPGIIVAAALACAVAGCAIQRPVTLPTEFFMATVEPGDTYAAIALRYLKDPSLGWLVSEFNRSEPLTPGQSVLVPIQPYRMGGIEKDGYQVVPVLLYRWPDAAAGGAEGAIDAFRRQMALLREEGFTVISLAQLSAFLDFKALLPKKSVAITFDDPAAAFFDAAFPVLRTFGYPAAIFIQTGTVGRPGRLSWKQLGELAANGMDIESRGRSRDALGAPAGGESFERYLTVLEDELDHSRAEIEERIGRPCRYLAYPSGRGHRLTAAFAEKAGYQGAFEAEGQPPPFFADRFRVGRTPVAAALDTDGFRRLLKTFEKIPSP